MDDLPELVVVGGELVKPLAFLVPAFDQLAGALLDFAVLLDVVLQLPLLCQQEPLYREVSQVV